ncbi:hypothetical protein OSB04_006603 [Centaurea solstitialis]|uniref:Integrase catalytic domain-containing protein n=1 Tax=Centaurea solstitialis TaxID=347529 RepID=A0AA38U2U4_9ASTR|nr:hypothetical protein OSB04_006603 [Centaurea solstitialis]
MDEGESEYLFITNISSRKKNVLEKLSMYFSGLYYTKISAIETNMVINQKFMDRENFILWHDRLGHPGSVMMRKIIEQSCGHPLENQKILQTKDMTCVACSKGKIQGDICGPIHPPCGPFRYFMVLIDASTKWSHVCLLSSRNLAFARLLAQLIRLRSHFPDYPIKTIRLDNTGEFTSQIFNDYCMSIGIKVEHPVTHVHTQNGLAESLIKRLQMIARPMIMKSKLPVSAWGHAILHAATLIRIRPTSYNASSPLKTVFGQELNISHLRIFGCAVYVPIAPPQRTNMGPQRRLGIYVGYESASIIKYLKPLMGDLFTARFADCHFDESEFPALGGGTKQVETQSKISWSELSLFHLDPRTKECELEVQRIIHLQGLANQLPDTFTDLKRVTKSHVPAANTPIKIDVPKGQDNMSNESEDARSMVDHSVPKIKILKRKRELIIKMVISSLHNLTVPSGKNDTWTFLHYITRDQVLKRFYMDKSHPLSTPMVVRSLDVEKDHFRPPTADEDILGPEVPYLSAIGALMFLAGHTRPDISFSLNLLARYSSCPTKTHWNGIKQIFRYLQGTKNLGLYFANLSKGSLYGFADAGYLSDPHTGRSQSGYVFTMGGTAISWRSTKQTMTATSSNHAEILAIHEASRECVWLRNVIQHIRGSCGIITDKEPPTILYEDNAACIAQLKEGYIKGDRTNHILPKFFFTHDLQKSGDIIVQQVRSCENLADLFTKSLLNSTFQRLVHDIGMRRLKDLK